MIRSCAVLAIDGTHSSGKSTLVGALVDHYTRAGVNVATVPDPARGSPLITAAVNDPDVVFDLAAELDLLAVTISAQIRAAVGRDLLVVDKTTSNVLAYANLFLDHAYDRQVLTAAAGLCRAWQPYDLVIRCCDHFPIDLSSDGFRAKVTDLQVTAGEGIRTGLHDAGYPVVDLPTGLTTTQRVAWVTAHPTLAHLHREA